MSLVFALLAGCTPLAPPEIDVTGVTPAWGYAGDRTEVEIAGERFFPGVIVDPSDDDGGRLEGTFEAWLETDPPTELTGVEHRGYDRLHADVPSGMTPGVYDLRVRAPSGAEDVLEDAFTVTSTRADHLRLGVETAAWTVDTYAPLRVQLADPEGDPVAQPIAVEIVASSSLGAQGVTFLEDGLEDQEAIPGGVRGALGADGSGIVLVTSTVPDDVTFTATAAEDPVVRADSLVVSWDPGEIDSVQIDLPRSGFRTVAGDTFEVDVTLLDAHGNVLEDETAAILLYEACGDWLKTVTVHGTETVDVTLTQACDANAIGAYSTQGQWSSDPFEVLPAEPDRYALQATPEIVVAGTSALLVLVEAVDAYGNVAVDHPAQVRLRDDLGGLDPDTGIGVQSCPGFPAEGEARQLCTAALWAAGTATVSATDADGLSGDADPVEVLPASAALVVVGSATNTVAAGDPFDVTVRVLDAYGNNVSFDPGGTDPVAFEDDTGTLSCAWRGALGGGQTFSCVVEAAVVADTVAVRVLGLYGELPDPLEVTNAELAVVEVDVPAAGAVAGTAFPVTLNGYDVYGNPYVEQTDPDLELSDTTGALSPTTARLDATGEVTVSATITQASPSVTVTASQGGVALGTSAAFAVSAASLFGLEVEAPPWIAVGEPTEVVVVAVDVWGNPIPGYAGTVTLESRSGLCGTETISAFDAGAGVVDLQCGTAGLSDTLKATDVDGYGGSAGGIDVVDLACADGPVADLKVDGGESATVCLLAGTVDVDLDASGAVAGGASLTLYHYADSDGTTARSLSDAATFTYETAGARRVEVLVVDRDACADLAEALVYAGEDDGEPVGPVTLTASAASVASGGSVTVDVVATDCTGDLAAGGTVLAWADLGTPSGSSTGGGLATTLDATGEAGLTWTFPTGYAADATLTVGTAGGAVGTAEVTVTQDGVRPQVVAMTPSGRTLEAVDVVEVTFTEALYSGNVSGVATLMGPSGTVSTTASVSSDGKTLTLVPGTAVDGAAGAWTLTLSASVRDAAGNRMDGAWTGAPSAFTGTFGAVTDDGIAMTGCTASAERFFPDGDDGAGDEDDDLTVTLAASSTPTWWAWQALDADGTAVRSGRASGADASFAWDGRGDDGRIVVTGKYTLRTRAMDAQDNQSDACEVEVTVGQHVEAP